MGGQPVTDCSVNVAVLCPTANPETTSCPIKVLMFNTYLPPYDVTVNITTFMKGKNQIHPMALANDRKIAAMRVLIERVINGFYKDIQHFGNSFK